MMTLFVAEKIYLNFQMAKLVIFLLMNYLFGLTIITEVQILNAYKSIYDIAMLITTETF